MVALASDVKLDVSMRIEARGDPAKVALAAEVSVVAAMPCAVDGYMSTVGNCISEGPERRFHAHTVRRFA